MPMGLKEFNGDRLKEAREARSLTGVTLAELTSVGRPSLSQYEHGTRAPSPDVLERIARAVNLPVSFFMEPSRAASDETLFFRSKSASTKTARTREQRRFDWHVDIASFLQAHVVFPSVNFPELNDLPDDPSRLKDDDVDRLALAVRSFWGLGEEPVGSVVEVLERNGAIVSRYELGVDSLDAYSGWRDGVPHVILGADKGSAARSRFDAAHELGHLVLHSKVAPNTWMRSEVLKQLEAQAHFFASAFLLPAQTFSSDVTIPTLESFLALKPTWRASVGAMIRRAVWLRLIDNEQERRLWIARSRRGWNTREPFDDELDVEKPRLLSAAFRLAFEARKFSIGQLRVSLPYSLADIEYLSGLPEGYLTGAEDRGLLRPLESTEDERPRVLSFPTDRRS